MKKKLLPISLLAFFGIVIAGCTGPGSKESQQPSSEATSEPGTSEPASSSSVPGTSEVQPVDPTGVTLDRATANVVKGQTLQLAATVAPENANNKEITWSSDDEDVATVSKTGLVTAVEVGYAKITAKIKNTNLKAECDISVIKQLNSMSISNKSAFEGFTVDDSESLNFTFDPEDNATALVTAGVLKVTSSDPTVASISGLTVTGLKAGTTTIKAELFGKEDSFQLTVGEAINGDPYTVADAFAKAITEAPWNGKAGSGSRITATCFVLTGKVVAVSPNGETGVDIILDDGTQAVYLQFTKAANDVFPVAVGEYAKVTCKFTNYYGLFEGVSRKAVDLSSSPKIPLKDIEKIDTPETPITPYLNAAENMDAAAYEAYYNVCKVNGTKDDPNATFTSIKRVKLAITYNDGISDNFKYVIDGTNNKYGLEIYKSDLIDEPFEGQKSTVEVYLISCNTGKSKSNSILIEQTPLAVESFVLDQGPKTIVHGNSIQLTYTTTPAGSYSRNVTWTSSNEQIATVENGLVTGIYVGDGTQDATITLKIGQEEKTVVISVFGETVPATAVELNKTSLSLVEGQKEKLTATTTPGMVSDLAVWSSSNSAIAKVDQEGNVEAVAEGTANIVVTYNETVSATCAVTVAKLTAMTAYVGAEINAVGKLVAKNGKTGLVDDGTGIYWGYASANVSFNVGDMVNVSGKVVAYNGGVEISPATFAAAVDGSDVTPSAAAALTEAEALHYVEAYTADKNACVPHRHVTLRTGVIGGSGNYLTWQFGNAWMETSVSTGNMKAGLIYDVDGYLINFYKDNSANKTYLCMAVVTATQVHFDPTDISLDKNYAEVEEGANITLKATVGPSYADKDITWLSSDQTVATVDANGKVTGVAAGKAVITAKAGKDANIITDSCVVTVVAASGGQQEPLFKKVTALQNGKKYVLAAYGSGDGNGEKVFYMPAATATIEKNPAVVEMASIDDLTKDLAWDVTIKDSTKITFSHTVGDKTYYLSATDTAQGITVKDADDGGYWTLDDNGLKYSAGGARYMATYNNGTVRNYSAPLNASTQAMVNVFYEFNGADETPAQEMARPNGSYSGYMVMPTAQGDLNVFTNIALGGENAYVEIYFGAEAPLSAYNYKAQTTYLYDAVSGLVTIVLGGQYGNLTAFFDETNNKLVNVGIHGNAGANLSNNLEAELVAAPYFFDCEGTTEQLQASFKRRYADPWTVDTGNADRFTSVDNGISGKGMKVRAWNGGRYSFCFGQDFPSAITVSNIGFWVYNSSNKDVTLRMWYYTQTGLSGAGETGSVVAKANGWTYCRMGFGSKNIYNFQIADFNKTGVALVFDNICLF